LKTGALVTAGVGAGAPGAQAEPPRDVRLPAYGRYSEFVVVGAGFAGMAAAWELRKRGRSVIVLEAGPRIGGRTWTMPLSDGTPFEIGGQWITGTETQQDVLDLIHDLQGRRMQVQLFPQYDVGGNIFVDGSGAVSPWDPAADPLPPISPEGALDAAAALVQLTQMATAVNPLAPWDPVDFPQFPLPIAGPDGSALRNTVDADRLTVDTWMELNMLAPPAPQDGKALLRAAFGAALGVHPAAASLLHMAFFIASSGSVGGNPPSFLNLSGSEPGQAEAFRLVGGTASIMNALHHLLGGPTGVLTSSPVREISWSAGGGAVVRSDRAVVRARHVIVAVPTALVSFIRFVPPLPPDRAQLQHRFPQGSVWKIWLAYDQAWWRQVVTSDFPQGFTGETTSIDPADFVTDTRDAGRPDRLSPGLLNAFVIGDNARRFAALTRDERRARVLAELVHRFGAFGFGGPAAALSTRLTFPAVPPQNPAPDAYFEYNWALDEWARGDFAAVPGRASTPESASARRSGSPWARSTGPGWTRPPGSMPRSAVRPARDAGPRSRPSPPAERQEPARDSRVSSDAQRRACSTMSSPTISLHACSSRPTVGPGFPSPIGRRSTRLTGRTHGLVLVKKTSSAV
jgi:monoamine oxidase